MEAVVAASEAESLCPFIDADVPRDHLAFSCAPVYACVCFICLSLRVCMHSLVRLGNPIMFP